LYCSEEKLELEDLFSESMELQPLYDTSLDVELYTLALGSKMAASGKQHILIEKGHSPRNCGGASSAASSVPLRSRVSQL
jgi:hypothetical protein